METSDFILCTLRLVDSNNLKIESLRSLLVTSSRLEIDVNTIRNKPGQETAASKVHIQSRSRLTRFDFSPTLGRKRITPGGKSNSLRDTNNTIYKLNTQWSQYSVKLKCTNYFEARYELFICIDASVLSPNKFL